jgi:hypothetical protein
MFMQPMVAVMSMLVNLWIGTVLVAMFVFMQMLMGVNVWMGVNVTGAGSVFVFMLVLVLVAVGVQMFVFMITLHSLTPSLLVTPDPAQQKLIAI